MCEKEKREKREERKNKKKEKKRKAGEDIGKRQGRDQRRVKAEGGHALAIVLYGFILFGWRMYARVWGDSVERETKKAI